MKVPPHTNKISHIQNEKFTIFVGSKAAVSYRDVNVHAAAAVQRVQDDAAGAEVAVLHGGKGQRRRGPRCLGVAVDEHVAEE